MANEFNRRQFVKRSMAGSLAAAALSFEEQNLLAQTTQNASRSAPDSAPAAAKLPMGQIGKVNISRVICGGNLFNGFAHSRDLVYVSELLKNYFTDEKIIETLELCEANGINTVVGGGREGAGNNGILGKYWKERGGTIQWLAQLAPDEKDYATTIQKVADAGAVGAFVMGNVGDKWARTGKVELIGKCIDCIRQNGMIAGVAGHSLKTIIECEKAALKPDFYMKTLHSAAYWSKRMPDQDKEVIDNYDVDNYWDLEPQKTIEFMKSLETPWLAYKVLAAGAIHPKDGFKYAFENGADFIVAGMFDFQIIEDVSIARQILGRTKDRARPWYS